MLARKDRFVLINVFTVLMLFALFLASAAPAGKPAFAGSIAPRAALAPGAAPGAFGKTSPANGVVLYTPDQTLAWAESAGATNYEVCVDLTNDTVCDPGWNILGLGLHQDIHGLLPNTTYYWQARANTGGNTAYTYANGGAWWHFRTSPPTAFGKQSPANVTIVGTASLTLTWKASTHVTRYEYCFDSTNDAACDTPWIDAGLTLSAPASGLVSHKPYYWQVRAVNAVGTIEADSGVWWLIRPLPPVAFNKSTPADASTTFSAAPTVTWAASSNATRYEVCVDTSNNSTCDTAWQDAGATPTAALSLTQVNIPYYWQVRAVNDFGNTEANTAAWWRITRLPNFPRYMPIIGKGQ